MTDTSSNSQVESLRRLLAEARQRLEQVEHDIRIRAVRDGAEGDQPAREREKKTPVAAHS